MKRKVYQILAVVILTWLAHTSVFGQEYEFVNKWPDEVLGLRDPVGVAVDSSGNVYVTDVDINRVIKYNSSGSVLLTIEGYGSGNGQFCWPEGVAVDSFGNVYVADTGNCRIQKFDSNGTYITQWGTDGTGNGQFYSPCGVAVDSFGNVYVVDFYNSRIQKFNSNGTYITQWGTGGSGNGQFHYPCGVAVDSLGNVYVADTDNDRIQKFNSNGTYITQWGNRGDGNGQFYTPRGVAVNTLGKVYVADRDYHRIQVFSPSISINLKNKMTALGREVKNDDLGAINQDQTSSQYTFNNNKAQNLAFGLNWAGSILKLSVYKPDGSLFTEKQGAPPLIIQVPNAEIGDWHYTVTGVDVPNNDYPYAVQVGILKTVTGNTFLKAGWNMVSTPVVLSNPLVEALIPQGSNIIPPLYTYDPSNFSYKEVSEVKPGEGYWVLTIADEVISTSGTPVTSLVLNLKPGWNMIGSVISNVDFTDPQDTPDDSVILPIYTYNPTTFSYEEKTIIEPGVGYWVLSLQDCTLKLDATTASPPKDAIAKTNQVIKPDWILPIQMRTGGTTNEIYLGIHKEASEGFDPKMDIAMPPKFDTGSQSSDLAFVIDDRLIDRLSRDVRKMTESTIWKIQAKVPSSGSELTWDVSSLQNDKDMILRVELSEVDMRQQSLIRLSEGVHIIEITLRNRIPQKTTLLQNYPNPFNPETWIPYELSKGNPVIISIYDTEGKLVRKLDLGYREAGIYVNKSKSAYWDGKNETGEVVSSGVYFYTLVTPEFFQTRKLVILR
jgi:streptogramin lyase